MLRAVRHRMQQLGRAVGSRHRAVAKGLVGYTQCLRPALEETQFRL